MKVLIVKTSALGDIIQTYPVIDYIKQRFPHAHIDWVVEERCRELVERHPSIRSALCLNTKQWRQGLFSRNNSSLNEIKAFRKRLRNEQYDVVFDLQGNIKSGLITSQAYSKDKVGFAFKSAPEWPNTFFTNQRYNPPKGQNIRADYLYLVKSYFALKPNKLLPRIPADQKKMLLRLSLEEQASLLKITQNPALQGLKKVLVCPGSAWRNKQMTLEALETFLKQVQKLLNCVFILVWGTEEERALAEHLQQHFGEKALLTERLSLPALQSLMAEMNLIIAMDSLPLHLAGSTGVPTFSIFGASSGHKYCPSGNQNTFFQGSCPYGMTFEKRCSQLRTCQTGACIRSLKGTEVFESLSHFYSQCK